MQYVINVDRLTKRATSFGMVAETFEEQRIIGLLYGAFRSEGTIVDVTGKNGERLIFSPSEEEK